MPQWKNNLGEWILVCSATNGKTFRVMKTCRFSAAPGFLKYLFEIKEKKKQNEPSLCQALEVVLFRYLSHFK
jgi:hypothetical protein